MKKINSINIKHITVQGFKCFKERTEFNFGDFTYITGSNGFGKSSIADAIAYAITGTPFFGDRFLDRLQNKNSNEMEVSVEFTEDSGVSHTLTRNRKNGDTTIIYDSFNVRQADLNAMFGEKDEFLSIFNPLYFIDILGENGKELIEKMLPVVEHETILAALPESSRKILANEHLTSPETYIKNRRAEIRECENALIEYNGQQDLLERQRKERTENLNKLSSELDKVNAGILELEILRDKEQNTDSETQLLENLKKRRNELLSGNGSVNVNIANIANEIRALELSIAERTAESYVSQYIEQLLEAKATLKVLRAEHDNLKENISKIEIGYKCPTCLMQVNADNIEAVRAELQKKLSALVTDGKNANIEYHKLMAAENNAAQEFENKKNAALMAERSKLSELQQRLHEYDIERDMDAANYSDEISSVDSQIKELECKVSLGNLSAEQAQQLDDLIILRIEYTAKIEALNSITDSHDYAQHITNTEAEIKRLKILINEAGIYTSARSEILLNQLKMNRAEIILHEVIKSTGELKDCFKFSFDGRDFKCLSLSEKIKAGLEVSELIMRLSGRKYPTFIDNIESVVKFENFKQTTQMIAARVTQNAELKFICRKLFNAA